MGGSVQKFGQAVGVDKKPKAPAPQAPVAQKPKISKASAADEMMGARMRGARRRGRQLLSDARLNAESGVQTLGSEQQL
jgi:hypothetical protein